MFLTRTVPALVKRRTDWMTNSKRIVAAVERKCSRNHRRCHVTSGAGLVRALRIERDPHRLLNTVLRALWSDRFDEMLDNTSTNLTCG